MVLSHMIAEDEAISAMRTGFSDGGGRLASSWWLVCICHHELIRLDYIMPLTIILVEYRYASLLGTCIFFEGNIEE